MRIQTRLFLGTATLVLALLAFASTPAVLHAAGTLGTIEGTVRDATGGILPGSTVTVRNVLGFATKRLKPYPEIKATLAAFYAALQQGTPLPTEAEEGLAIVELMERIQEQIDVKVEVPA